MRAALYQRISRDRTGDETGVERQGADTEALAKRKGYEVVAHFTDNDITAAGKVKRRRPQYDAMLEAAKAGQFDVIVAYSNSRLTRRPRELEDLLDLHDDYGVKIDTVVSGQDDLSMADGRMVARIKVSVDAAEAEKVSERVIRQKQQRAEQGNPIGSRWRTFGYERDWSVKADEAKVVRAVFKRIVAGESKGSVTRWLNEKGHTTTAGKPWSHRTMDRMLSNGMYAGLQMYRGEVVGKSSVVKALVDEKTYYAANSDRLKAQPGHNTRKYLLTNILVCDSCKSPMVGHAKADRGARYRCNQKTGCGITSIKAEWVDNAVDAYMMSLSGFAAADRGPVAVDHSDEIAALDRRIETLHGAERAGEIDLPDLMRLLRETRNDREQLLRSQAAADVSSPTFKDGWVEWEALDLSAKRARIKTVFEYIFVRPWTHTKGFDERRLYALTVKGEKVEAVAWNVLHPIKRTYQGPRGPVPEPNGDTE